MDETQKSEPTINITLQTSVDVNKSIVIANGFGESSISEAQNTRPDHYLFPCATLENSNTLQVRGGGKMDVGSSSDTYYIKVAWQVIEFY